LERKEPIIPRGKPIKMVSLRGVMLEFSKKIRGVKNRFICIPTAHKPCCFRISGFEKD